MDVSVLQHRERPLPRARCTAPSPPPGRRHRQRIAAAFRGRAHTVRSYCLYSPTGCFCEAGLRERIPPRRGVRNKCIERGTYAVGGPARPPRGGNLISQSLRKSLSFLPSNRSLPPRQPPLPEWCSCCALRYRAELRHRARPRPPRSRAPAARRAGGLAGAGGPVLCRCLSPISSLILFLPRCGL